MIADRPASRARFGSAAAYLCLCTVGLSLLQSAGGCQTSSPASAVDGATAPPDVQWADLLAGSDLDNWTTSGELDAWAVADGELWIRRPGRGGWLRTKRTYRDFELQLDFLVPEGGNSGVGLRGSSQGDPAFTGFEIQILDSSGQQPALTNCGAVYDAVAPRVMAVNAAGQWNTYRIRLVGDRLDAWLNDVRIHDDTRLDSRGYVHSPDNLSPLRDRLPTGFISLQDHGDAVRFRDIRVRDLSPDPDPGGFEPLLGGNGLDGWTAYGGGAWSVEAGAIVGRDGPGHLFTNEQFTDFELRAFVKVNSNGNSGLYVRVRPRRDDPHTWPEGYEAQVDNHDSKNFTGCIYDRAWPATGGLLTRDDAWFDYRIRAMGDHIRTWINGVPMVDATLRDFGTGRIALQTHHPGNEIMYKDLRVRPLNSAE